jgi:hypothetical protein
MRLVVALASVLLLAGAGGAATGTSLQGRCARALPHLGATLPDSIVLTTDCGRFRLESDGHVGFAGSYTMPVPPEVRSWSPFDLSWFGVEHDHLVIGRAMQRLWRSHGSYSGTYPGDVEPVLGQRAFAFEYIKGRRSSLYFVRHGGAERVIGHGETPLVFAEGKLVTQSEHGGALILRGSDGRRLRVIAVHPNAVQVDREGKMVLFRLKGRLFVFDGVCVRDLVSLRRLGLGGAPLTVEPLGRLLAVHDERRLIVLDYDGRLVASTPLPRRPKRADGISSAVVANPAGTAVAFTATSGNTAYGSSGRETVYVLAAGERRARPVFSERLVFKVCERIADLAWRGRWLLYDDTELRAALVDTSGEAPPLELHRVIAGLPGLRSDGRFDVSWS